MPECRDLQFLTLRNTCITNEKLYNSKLIDSPDALSYYLYADLASMWSTVAVYSLEQDVDIADNLEAVL